MDANMLGRLTSAVRREDPPKDEPRFKVRLTKLFAKHCQLPGIGVCEEGQVIEAVVYKSDLENLRANCLMSEQEAMEWEMAKRMNERERASDIAKKIRFTGTLSVDPAKWPDEIADPDKLTEARKWLARAPHSPEAVYARAHGGAGPKKLTKIEVVGDPLPSPIEEARSREAAVAAQAVSQLASAVRQGMNDARADRSSKG